MVTQQAPADHDAIARNFTRDVINAPTHVGIAGAAATHIDAHPLPEREMILSHAVGYLLAIIHGAADSSPAARQAIDNMKVRL